MSKMPEALRLADIIGGNCADELRRLHAVNAKLVGTLKEIGHFASDQWVSEAAQAAITKAEEVKP